MLDGFRFVSSGRLLVRHCDKRQRASGTTGCGAMFQLPSSGAAPVNH